MINNKELIENSDYIVSFGSLLSYDDSEVCLAIAAAISKNDAQFIYSHPIDSIDLKLYYTQFVKYEVGSEEGIASLLVDAFVKESNDDVQEFIDDLDLGYISAESSAGEEEFEQMYENSKDKKSKVIIVGEDIFSHKRVKEILKLLKTLEKYAQFKIILLDEKYKEIYENCTCQNLEEVEELDSYNGTIIYRCETNEKDILVGSASFSRVAKIQDGDKIEINYNSEKIQRVFKIDKDLQGTIALCGLEDDKTSSIFKDYRYKIVKIEKVE